LIKLFQKLFRFRWWPFFVCHPDWKHWSGW